MRIPRSGRWPALAIVVMGAFIALNWYAGAESLIQYGVGEAYREENPSRHVEMQRFYSIDPGDRIDLFMGKFNGQDRIVDKTRFYIVEGGEGDAFFEGRRPEHILHESGFWFGKKSFYRPEPYAGKPHEQGLNGDLYHAIDLVWVYTPAPSTSRDDLRAESLAYRSTWANFGFEAYDDKWLTLQWLSLVGASISGAAAVALIIVWARGTRLPADPDGPPVERLLSLQARARGYLRMVYDMMLWAGGFLVLGSVAIVLLTTLAMDLEPALPFDHWKDAVIAAVTALLSLVVAMWGVQFARIRKEHRRWLAAPPPPMEP